MSDQFDDLFAALRTETIPGVRPPGADSARETVRRRRTRKRVVAVTTTALAVLGIAGVTAIPRLTGPGREGASAAVDAAERPGGTTLAGLVGLYSEPSFPKVAAGDYTVTAACEGTGSLDVRAVRVAGDGTRTDLGGQTVVCAPDPASRSWQFRMAAAGDIVVTLAGDSGSAETAHYAVTLSRVTATDDTFTPSDLTMTNTATARDILERAGLSAQSMTTELIQLASPWESTADGEFVLRVACVGPGSVALVVTDNAPGSGRSGAELVDEKISCTEEAIPQAYPSHNRIQYKAGRQLWVTVTPDAAARDVAGFAYALQPAG
ncbi:hypothetical protein [Symbioplanes lichenis]|uniref:hypothetical protein n=1 Tax=Symbioplanes lichenis TaxID=1629072 RepID=UPI002739A0B2|nr:hypothetical protein [Actinoplanes lichenis]